MAADDFKDRMKEITDKLETGISDIFTSEKYADFLKTMSKFHNYSTKNTLLIHMQMPNASQIAGFRAWEEKFGRRVKKGEHGIRIYAPVSQIEKKSREKLDADTKTPIIDEYGNMVTEEVEDKQIRFKLIPVFDVSQTYGKPLPELAEAIKGNVAHYEAFLETLKKVSPLPIEFESLTNTDGICYYGNRIAINTDMSEIQTISAIVHEITHAVLHDVEIQREEKAADSADFKAKDKRTAEVEAESVSYAVCQYFGIETSQNSFGYIASWSSNRELSELKSSLDTIRKTATMLIGKIDENYKQLAKERDVTPTADISTEVSDEQPVVEDATQQEKGKHIKYSDLQQQGFEIAKRYETLPLQDRLNIIAKTFNCETASIKTIPCSGKYRGYSDIYIALDNGASLGIGTRRTPQAKTAKVINECVNNTLTEYNPEIVSELKAKATDALSKRQIEDNMVAEEKGLKPYKFLSVELNAGSEQASGGYLGWYYARLEIDGKTIDFLETGLCSDIERGVLSEHISRPNYFVAGGLRDDEVDFVFNNVGHSSWNGSHQISRGDNNRMNTEIKNTMHDKEDKLEKQYELGFGHLGNGLSVWNRFEEKNNDYVKVAHIDFDRTIKFYDEQMPEHIKAEIIKVAQTSVMTVSVTQDTPVFSVPAISETLDIAEKQVGEPDIIMPDPNISTQELIEYGYNHEDMLPLTQDRATELYDLDLTIYMIYPDNTEAMVFEREEIINAENFIFGIDKADWENSKEYLQMKQEKPEQQEPLENLDSNTFSIYQLKNGDEQRYHRFASIAQLEKDSLKVEAVNYNMVYTAKLENMTLDGIYSKFNNDHPKDFTGHSLSVSDVIILKQDNQISSFYVDNFGFKELSCFLGTEVQKATEKPFKKTVEREMPSLSKSKPSILAQLQKDKRPRSESKDIPKTTTKHDRGEL